MTLTDQQIAAITGTDTLHFHLDHLGTPRLITYLNGTASAERHDYYPFGEEVSLAGNEERDLTRRRIFRAPAIPAS